MVATEKVRQNIMENIYDLAILGAGPAGICAAIYATRAKLNTTIMATRADAFSSFPTTTA